MKMIIPILPRQKSGSTHSDALVFVTVWLGFTFLLGAMYGLVPSSGATVSSFEPNDWERAAFRKEFGVPWEARHEYPMPKTRGQTLSADDLSPESPFAYEFERKGVPRVGVVTRAVSWKWKNGPVPYAKLTQS